MFARVMLAMLPATVICRNTAVSQASLRAALRIGSTVVAVPEQETGEAIAFGLSNSTKSAEEEELAGLLWLEKELKTKLADLQEKKYEERIAREEKLVANETTAGVADMLASMREQMHRFGAPFYEKVLKEEIVEVKKKQTKLLQKINEGEDEEDDEEEDEEDEEDDEEEDEKDKQQAEVKERKQAESPVAETGGAKTSWWFSITLIVLGIVGIAGLLFFFYKRRQAAGPASSA